MRRAAVAVLLTPLLVGYSCNKDPIPPDYWITHYSYLGTTGCDAAKTGGLLTLPNDPTKPIQAFPAQWSQTGKLFTPYSCALAKVTLTRDPRVAPDVVFKPGDMETLHVAFNHVDGPEQSLQSLAYAMPVLADGTVEFPEVIVLSAVDYNKLFSSVDSTELDLGYWPSLSKPKDQSAVEHYPRVQGRKCRFKHPGADPLPCKPPLP
jgi:hypothetical protein